MASIYWIGALILVTNSSIVAIPTSARYSSSDCRESMVTSAEAGWGDCTWKSRATRHTTLLYQQASCDVWLGRPRHRWHLRPVSLTIFCSHFKFDGNFTLLQFHCLPPDRNQFCTCHDSTAVMLCAKCCCDHSVRIEVTLRVKRNFQSNLNWWKTR